MVRSAPGEFSLDVDVDVDGGRGVYGGKGEFLKVSFLSVGFGIWI